ncbi:MAG: phytoene desaturase family protein [Anaerolineales bacterium]
MANENTYRSKYDVIVIGGGPNGLVTAAYLGKAGRSVLLLEKREMVGGIAVTEEFFPGYKSSSIVSGAGHLSPEVVEELNLVRNGLQVLPADPLIFSPLPDGNHITIWQDVNRTAQEIANFSAADAQAYPAFVNEMAELSGVVAGLKNITPPDLPDAGLGDMRELLKIADPLRSQGRKKISKVLRVMAMPISDLLNEWFESDIVKGAIAVSAVNNSSWGPQEAGTAYTFLHNWSGSNNGLFRSSGQVKGGMGSLAQAIAKAAEGFGVEVLTNTEVIEITRQDDDATGIVLANGDQISAATIVTAVDMRTTFLKLVDPYYLDQMFVKHVQNIKYRGTLARVHFALDQLPDFTALNGDARQLLSGHVQIAPTMKYIQDAFDPAKYGRYTEQPYLDIQIPTLTDSSLAPEGKHIMSVSVKYMPYHLRRGNWNELRDMLGGLVMQTIAEYAPEFQKSVQRSQVITPLDLETVYSLPEGNPIHGAMTLDQFLWMRPVPGYGQYRSPLAGLYLCSSATHPGGGVTGINGKNAAREVLKDW